MLTVCPECKRTIGVVLKDRSQERARRDTIPCVECWRSWSDERKAEYERASLSNGEVKELKT